MAIAEKLDAYLRARDAAYDLVAHPLTGSSMATAEVAHVPGDRLAKAVIVRDKQHYVMIVLPSDHHLELDSIGEHLEAMIGMASEGELAELFPDCALGAIPPFGGAYGLKTLWDSALASQPEIYFEAGDHQLLVRVTGEQFRRLMGDAVEGRFSHHL
jgi:Ala-tRNA(Pro) deacylase